MKKDCFYCIHSVICQNIKNADLEYGNAACCKYFDDESNYTKLPIKVGDCVWVAIDGEKSTKCLKLQYKNRSKEFIHMDLYEETPPIDFYWFKPILQTSDKKMKNEFKQALENMQNLILDFKEKYHIEQDDFVKIALQMNKIVQLAPAGTFEGDEK